MNKLIAAVNIAVMVLNLLGCAQVTSSTVYRVGDGIWAPDYDYSQWVKGKTFFMGDTFLFRYGEGYSVDEVTAENFKKCDATGSIFTALDGNTTIPLNKFGVHYFIGGAFQACSLGMNLTVVVN